MPKLSPTIFAGVYPTGIRYYDRAGMQAGDYKPLAFLSFHDLELHVETDCPIHLESEIRADARTIQDRRGELYHYTLTQMIVLGWGLE